MADKVDMIMGPFKEWLKYIETNHTRYFLGLFKIKIVTGIIGLAILVLFLLLAAAIVYVGGIQLLPVIAALIVFILGIVLLSWIQSAFSLTAVVYTDAEFNKKKFGIFDSFGKIKWPVLRYMLVSWIIAFIINLPLIIVLVAMVGGIMALMGGFTALMAADKMPAASFSAIMATIMGLFLFALLAMIYGFIVSTIYGFLVQFWTYGFLVRKQGVIDGLKSSVDIIKKNILVVFGFDLAWLIVGLMFAAPLIIYRFFSEFIMRLIINIGLMDFTDSITWVVIAVILLIHVVATLLLTTLIEFFMLPTQYLMWKKLAK